MDGELLQGADDGLQTRYVCSECSAKFPVGEVLKFCPNCGARVSSVSQTEVIDTRPKPHVLLVDDSLVARHRVVGILRNLGCDVSEAGDGKQALKMLDSATPDLLVLDVNMPNMTGLDVLEKIRGTERHASLRVVMLTGEADVRVVARAISLKANDYLRKDDSVEELTKRLAEHVDKCRS